MITRHNTIREWLIASSVEYNSSTPNIFYDAVTNSGISLDAGPVLDLAYTDPPVADCYLWWCPKDDSIDYVLSYNGSMILKAQSWGRGKWIVTTDFGVWNGTQDSFERAK